MFFCLPPAGNPIILNPSLSTEQDIESLFKLWRARFFGSGAMALAAAIIATIKKLGISDPEVLLPAYGCPELVSAVLYAGAKPILVDLESKRPWLSLKDVKSKLTNNTVAIIAVDLFGIPERIKELREITKNSQVTIIEDSAQYFPENISKYSWQGDLVILSFGRGKPVSLLGGGAVLTNDTGLLKYLPEVTEHTIESLTGLPFSFKLKAALYNCLISPRLYWIPNVLPFLGLGEVNYNPMKEIQSFPAQNFSLLKPNIENYQASGKQAQQRLSEKLSQIDSDGFLDLTVVCGAENTKLIRYPILVKNQGQRDSLFNKLSRKGLGATKMYKTPLSEIKGLEHILSGQGLFPNAKVFSQTLLTLPVHEHVEQDHVQKIQDILQFELL